MASGLVTGCWVFLAGTMPFAKYTNREKSKGEVATCPFRVPPLAPVPRRYILVIPARIFKLQPFRNMKGDFCRTPSIGFNGHRYSNLFDGAPLPSTLPCPPFSSTLISLSRSLLLAFFSPRRKPLHVTGACYRGLARARGKKEFASRSFLFFPFTSSAVDTRGLDLERKPRRQMRASARGNCSSSIFRAALFSPEKLDLEKRDGVALQDPTMRARVSKQPQWAGGFSLKYVTGTVAI